MCTFPVSVMNKSDSSEAIDFSFALDRSDLKSRVCNLFSGRDLVVLVVLITVVASFRRMVLCLRLETH